LSKYGFPTNAIDGVINLGFLLAIMIVAAAFQAHNYVFFNLYVSMLYRATLLSSMSLVMYIVIHMNRHYGDTLGTYVGLVLSFAFVGGIISLPFKLLSVFFGTLDAGEMYKDRDYQGLKKEEIGNRYSNMNETELLVALQDALVSERYEEAAKIEKKLERFK